MLPASALASGTFPTSPTAKLHSRPYPAGPDVLEEKLRGEHVSRDRLADHRVNRRGPYVSFKVVRERHGKNSWWQKQDGNDLRTFWSHAFLFLVGSSEFSTMLFHSTYQTAATKFI